MKKKPKLIKSFVIVFDSLIIIWLMLNVTQKIALKYLIIF